MIINFKYDIHKACVKIISDELKEMGLSYSFNGLGEIKIKDKIEDQEFEALRQKMLLYGITIINTAKESLVQKIKDVIVEMIYLEEKLPVAKTSTYLAEKLNLSYGHLSNLFSEETFSTIENFIILQKIERAKELLVTEEFNLTEIAYKLNYSSVAHLSNQFKKTTGLTPSTFQRIISRRKENNKIR
ncbi:helix-turn-helix domain-containing protein [Pleomorphovibrio marinus]|uniref:helix-turn-helix domain-containing protein n=1 Tax=Pleomorphovibrio marinus TaxID=2164132 RepID=UPI000E0BBA7A|nr:AraC family transcriptional regulator [Pleomorphovibrio marinus]